MDYIKLRNSFEKSFTNRCDNYRLISFMSYFLKAFLRIIRRRIRYKIEWFSPGLNTIEVLPAVNFPTQDLRLTENVHLRFLDYQKTFDKVRFEELWQILKNSRINYRWSRVIKNLHLQQTTKVIMENILSEDMQIVYYPHYCLIFIKTGYLMKHYTVRL